MKKGSKAAKAWGAKMRRLRGTKKRKTKRKTTTRKRKAPKRKAAKRVKKRKSRRKRLTFPSKQEELDAWSF